MTGLLLLAITLLMVVKTTSVMAADDCSWVAIKTAAEVAVSDGSSFQTESYFHDFDLAAVRFIDENEQLIAVEGSWGWISQNGEAQLGSEFHKLFALGHQYQALLLYFDELALNSRQTEQVEFDGGNHHGIAGDYPYGGTMHLIAGEEPAKPSGILFEFPGAPRIESRFSDWRESHGNTLPYQVEVYDGDRVFNYQYTDIDLTPQPPEWFFQVVKAPELDEIKSYRQQRKQLVANCESPATQE